MSASFYNAAGRMLGADLHDFYMITPDLAPKVIPALHAVYAAFDDSCDDDKTRPKNVTSDRRSMIQKGFKLIRILPHLPLTPAPPFPVLQAVNWGTMFALSGSVALLGVASVTGGGASLAVCVHGSFGANLNCGDPIDLPLNLVYNENSVVTRPTDMDIAEAVFLFAMYGLVSLGVGKAFDKLGDGWKSYVKKKIKDKIVIPIRKKAEDVVKDWVNDHAKDLKDKLRDRSRVKAVLGSLGVTHV